MAKEVTINEAMTALCELVEQLDGIGIPDWHGAEGLDLAAARDVVKRFESPSGALNGKDPVMDIQFDFGVALQKLKDGLKLSRVRWNVAGQWIALCRPDSQSDMDVPYAYLVNTRGEHVPWTPTQSDMLADDWFVRD